MPFKIPGGHEFRQRHLMVCGQGGIEIPVHFPISFQQGPGKDKEGDPHGRGQYFGERIEVDDMAILIQSLKCRNRSGLVSKIAVIVVFDDEGISFDRPF